MLGRRLTKKSMRRCVKYITLLHVAFPAINTMMTFIDEIQFKQEMNHLDSIIYLYIK